jgi:hypothetical protein
MDKAFYTKEAKCPICNNTFSTLKLKTSACYVDRKDEDFCTYYKGFNPMFYEIYVCPSCAYSASEMSFNELTTFDVQLLRNAFSGREVARNFCGERSINDVIATFKLALYTANKRGAKKSILAGVCLKIAWAYRMVPDEENEKTFLKFALTNYMEAFDSEPLPNGNITEMMLLYLMGEISRRLGEYKNAIFWFGKAIACSESRTNSRIEKMTRDQWAMAKEQFNSK